MPPIQSAIAFPAGPYNIIYADPPWNGLGYNQGKNGPSGLKCPARHYALMTPADIAALPVKELRDPSWCALFLWVTFPNLPLGLSIIEQWGFHYATVAFTWVKRNKVSDGYFVGCGNYTRANAELCLLGTHGQCQKRVLSHSVRQICDARVGRHSEKPAEIRPRIVELFGEAVPRIELFARERTPGWHAWGNELEAASNDV